MSELDRLAQELPPTWAIATLGDLVEYGRTNKAEPDEIDDSAWVLELEDIEKDSSTLLQRVTFGERQSKSTKNRFDTGDVLYGKLRPYLNKVLIADQPGYCTTEILPIKCPEQIDTRYLFYWLKHPHFLRYVEAESHGMNMPRLGTEAGRAAPLVLAPRPEQTRIADQLDTLLARIKACNDHLDAIPGLLKRFRQAVWDSAARGDLTGDWRAARNIALKWASCSLGDAIVEMRNGLSPKPSEHPPGKRILRISSVRPGVLDLRDYRYLDIGDQDAVAYTLRKGDLLFTRYNGTIDFVGACALVAKDINDYVYPDKLIRVRVNEKIVLPEFLAIAACAGSCRKQIEDFVKSSAGQKGISGGDLKALALFLPDIDEQAEIARRVQSLMIYDRLVEAIHSKAATFAERLPALTLAKAFRGELVPQDPDDEPASVLLARLAAERSLAGSELKARQTRAPRVTRAPTGQACRCEDAVRSF